MQRIFKIIFWASITFISLFIVVAILSRFIKVEFISNKTEYLFESVRFFGIPIAILLTLSGFIKRQDNVASIFGKVLLMIIISGLSVFFLIMSVFVSMCSWTTNKTLYIKKNNDSVKIVQREFGCGATDSGKPTSKLFQTRELMNTFILIDEIDTSKIDKYDWVKVEVSNDFR